MTLPSYFVPSLSRRAGLLGVLAAAMLCVLVMALTSGEMAWLRIVIPSLSNGMSMLEGLNTPLDMDHVVFFAGLAFVLRLFTPRWRFRWIAALLATLAVGTEVMQFWIPGRTPKLLDARDDMIGASLGIAAVVMIQALAPQASRLRTVANGLLVLGVALLPFQQWMVAGFLGYPLRAADLVFAMSLLVRAVAWASGGAPLRLWGVHGWWLAWVLVLAAATVVAAIPASTQMPAFGCIAPAPHVTQSIGKWVGVVYLVLLAVAISERAMDEGGRRQLVAAWLIGTIAAVAACIAAIAGFYFARDAAWLQPLLSHYGSLPTGPFPRVRGLFENANMACNYLVVSACLMLAAGAARWVQPQVATWGLAGIVLAAVSTVSPGLGGLALAAGVWFGWRAGAVRARRVWIAAGVLVATVVMAMMWINPVDPFQLPSIRWQIWQQAAAYWLAHPWLGGGLAVPVVGVAFTDPSGNAQWLTDAHNTWLNIGGQAGLLAVVVLAGLCIRLLRGGFRGIHATPSDPWPRAFLIAFVAAFLYGGLAGSFEDARHLWVLIGLLAAVDPVSFRSSRHAPAEGSTAK